MIKNNLPLFYEKNENSKLFAFVICVQVGSRNENMENNGISHLIEHLIFKRSAKRSAKEIANRMEDLGAIANAFTTKEQTMYYVRGLDKNFEKIVDLLFEIVFNSKFIEKEFEKEKKIIIDEITSYDDDAEELIYEEAEGILFGENSLALPIAGTKNSVDLLNFENTIQFYKNTYNLDNVQFSFIGNLEKEIVVSLINKKIEKYIETSLESVEENRGEYKSENDKFEVINSDNIKLNLNIVTNQNLFNKTVKKEFQQNHFLVLKSFVNPSEEDKITLALINFIFGDSMSSRLSYRFREANPISYSVFSSMQLYSDNVVYYIYISMDSSKLEKSKVLLKNEILKLNSSGVTIKELNRAKEQYKTSILLENESLTDKAVNIIKLKSQKEEIISFDKIEKKLDNITLEQVNQFCQNNFEYTTFSQLIYIN